MDEYKKKRLLSRGWKVGNTDEFLGLAPEEAVYIDLKLVLSDYLKKKRRQRRLTQAELGKLLRSSQSRVAKMESGDPSVSLDLLIRALLALGISRGELACVIESKERATAIR